MSKMWRASAIRAHCPAERKGLAHHSIDLFFHWHFWCTSVLYREFRNWHCSVVDRWRLRHLDAYRLHYDPHGRIQRRRRQPSGKKMTPRCNILALSIVFGGLWLVPVSWIDNGTSCCIIRNITGHECVGCGITRAFFHLIHGDLTTAFKYNWRIFIVVPVLVLLTIRSATRLAPNQSS